ncbi:MAG: response regulator [Anaerolineaceae bacterium]|nr:response regulator [Anaerolineaceae bacterium]
MKKVMLVDDDLTMRSLLKTLLELEGYQVIAKGDGDESVLIETIRQEKPNVLILDVFLHRANGLNLLNTIRQAADIHDTTVLMTSGMDVKDQCIEKGANGFLLKPYMPDELTNWLRVICG